MFTHDRQLTPDEECVCPDCGNTNFNKHNQCIDCLETEKEEVIMENYYEEKYG